MKRNLSLSLAALTITLLLTAACIHKAGGAPVTPIETASTYSASLSDANNAIEQAAEACASSGLATPQQVEPVIAWTQRVATIHLQMTAILRQAPLTAANLASIAALVDQLKASADAIPPEALGIKNPKSQQLFKADVANIYALADAVLTSLQAGGIH